MHERLGDPRRSAPPGTYLLQLADRLDRAEPVAVLAAAVWGLTD